MNKISDFFDYMYYRLTKAFSKWDIGQGSTAIAFIALCQLMPIVDINGLIIYALFDRAERTMIFSYYKFIIIGLGIFLVIYNYKKYSGKYWALNKKWNDETKAKKIWNGIIIILAILLPILIPFIILR